jgi:hypothetical protein
VQLYENVGVLSSLSLRDYSIHFVGQDGDDELELIRQRRMQQLMSQYGGQVRSCL